MALPVTIPNEFASATASIPLSQLDTNFTTLANAVNGISDGSETLANASVTVLTAGTANVTTLNTSGQVVFNDAGADVDFRVEGDTDANLLFVDAGNDRVGIGTSTPVSALNVIASVDKVAVIGAASNLDSDADVLWGAGIKETQLLNGTASRPGVLSIGGSLTANESMGIINFFRSGNTDGYRSRAYIRGSTPASGTANQHGGILQFATAADDAGNPTERMSITPAGAVEIANGNLVFSTNGTGIDFSASAGGGASSSLLDDYEEGTWTPSLKFDGADILMTYGTQTGHYTKIGNLVHIQLRITLTNKGTSTGNATIAGLPFTPQLNNGGLAYGYIDGAPNSAIWNTATQIPTLDFTSTLIQLRYVNNGNGTQHTQASFDNTTDLIMWGNYVV